MKKLLVTAIGAAVAFGAFAGEISTKRFDNETTGDKLYSELPGGASFWSEGDDASKTNKYTVSAAGIVACPLPFVEDAPDKALDIKTTFGKPLSVNIASGGTATNIPNSGLYFDSLVKFTVCEGTPSDTYDGAKIIMWLQEQYDSSENVTGTNLMVRAGYLSYNEGALSPVAVTPTNYVCTFGLYDVGKIPGNFADQWHRVTIKAIPDITTGSGVPGFAIYIDGSGTELMKSVNSTQDKWDSSFTLALTEGAKWLNDDKCLFPSMVQAGGNKGSLTSASFDGTGSITDIVFTDEPMAFAGDYVEPKAVITVDGEPYGSETGEYTDLASAIEALNGITADEEADVEFTLQKDVAFDGDLTINNTDEDVTIVIDLNGKTLTANEIILQSPVTITDSSEAKTGVIVADIYVDRDDAAGEMTLLAGTIDGYIEGTLEEDEPVYKDSVFLMGGTVKQDDIDPVGGYVLEAVPGTEFFNVVEYVAPTYTVKFISGEGSTTNEYTKEEGEAVVAPAPAAVEGKSFQAWDPAVVSPVVADATYTALYTNNIYTITFVIGENSSTVQKAYGSTIDSIPEIPVRPGYTGAWDDDPTGDTVTGDKTYTYTYSAQTYTITFVNEIGDDPASTNYTIASGEIILPTATTGNTGVQFDGWTNATITAAITSFNPTAENVGNFTLYAAWSSTGSTGYDGGDGNTFTIDPGAVATVESATGHQMTDTVAGSGVTYAQAYALGLIDTTTGDVADLDATIELKDGKVVVNLSSTPSAAYTITLKVYEKSSLTASWPVSPTQTYTLDDDEATIGFTPAAGGTNFYKTEVSISNK